MIHRPEYIYIYILKWSQLLFLPKREDERKAIEIEKFEMEPYVALRTREKLLPSFETINFTKC